MSFGEEGVTPYMKDQALLMGEFISTRRPTAAEKATVANSYGKLSWQQVLTTFGALENACPELIPAKTIEPSSIESRSPWVKPQQAQADMSPIQPSSVLVAEMKPSGERGLPLDLTGATVIFQRVKEQILHAQFESLIGRGSPPVELFNTSPIE